MVRRRPGAHDAPMSDPGDGTGTAQTRAEPRRLTRSRDQRIVAGVAGGLGEYFGVDPVVFRIGFVAVTLLGGSGIVLYLIGWLVLPEEGHRRSVGQAVVHRGTSGPALGVVLLLGAAILLLHDSFHWGFGRLTLSLALLGAGALLLLRASDDAGSPVPPPPAPPPPPAAPPPEAAGEPPPAAPPPPRPRRRRSALGRGTFGAVLVVGGLMGLLDATGAIDLSPEAYLATALLVTGLGLIVGTWWGRSRLLIVFGALLTLALGAVAAIDVPFRGGFGEKSVHPVSLDEVRSEYRLASGQLQVDLSRVDFEGRAVDIEATVAFGELEITLPPEVAVEVVAEAKAGQIDVLGQDDEGIGAEVHRSLRRHRDQGLVRLHLEVVTGRIEVNRAEA